MPTPILLPKLRPAPGIDRAVDEMPIPIERWRDGVRVWRDAATAQTFVHPAFCQEDDIPDKPFAEVDGDDNVFLPFIVGGTGQCAVGETAVGDVVMQAATNALEQNRWAMILNQMLTGTAGTPDASTNPTIYDLSANLGVGANILASMEVLFQAATACLSLDHVFIAHIAYLPRYKKELDLQWDAEAGVWRYGPWAFIFTNLSAGGDLFLIPRPLVGIGPVEQTDYTHQRSNIRYVVLEQLVVAAYSEECSFRITVTI
jgi:hypothetical protein